MQVEFESAEILTATDDGSLGHKGLVTEIFEKSAKENKINNFDVYACGPSAMLKETARIAAEHKLNCQLSLEEKMGCGIGVCLGCAVKTRSGYKLVCKDGPVFNASELIYE